VLELEHIPATAMRFVAGEIPVASQ